MRDDVVTSDTWDEADIWALATTAMKAVFNQQKFLLIDAQEPDKLMAWQREQEGYGRTPIDLIVDVARRCRLSPESAVPPPSCANEGELVRVSEMYGVLEAMYPNILAKDVMQSSLHGSSYASLVQRVVGRRGLLFVIKCDNTGKWVLKKELPASRKFVGKTISSKAASLCGAETHNFTAQRVEVFQVWSGLPVDPIVS
ncbi:unnamed protein product [Vitrella brassicaformis CCMP3155]|uniref:Uncharacterized protein n=1 Tax=Vitrella brassicaformis (strain CCMP3155) TaxID=1169540 RepID=A0A0G4F876_VITBC|nr:unnamed protein product [Vitrella brassicaformis CCMP3155]|eukprot:CEM08920.1 unnamed protein product [Vitrella brassicaformis CCMP3155]